MQSTSLSNQYLWKVVTNGPQGCESTLNTYKASVGLLQVRAAAGMSQVASLHSFHVSVMSFMFLQDLSECFICVVNQPRAQNTLAIKEKHSRYHRNLVPFCPHSLQLSVICPIKQWWTRFIYFLLFCLILCQPWAGSIIYCDRQPTCWYLDNKMIILKCVDGGRRSICYT